MKIRRCPRNSESRMMNEEYKMMNEEQILIHHSEFGILHLIKPGTLSFCPVKNPSAMGRQGDKMRLLALVLMICFSPAVFLGQSGATVSGTVNLGSVPVNSASVSLTLRQNPRVKFLTTTDSEGRYKFQNVPDGLYLLNASSGTVMQAAGEIDVRVASVTAPALQLMPMTPSIRESVTISADARQSIEQVSKTVDVITGQEMRDRADFSLIESLRTIPGFRVQQSGGFGRVATIKTRGLRNQDTAILVDGIRFRDASTITGDASAFLSDFTLTSVSKVEVLRGSGSSIYGTNSIGGTVDFQTPTARAGTHGQIGGAFGGLGLGRFRGNISHGTESGRFGVNAGLSRTAYTKGIDGRDNANNTNFQSRFDASPLEKTNISGRIFISDADVRLNSSPDTFGPLPVANSTIIRANPNVNFLADVDDPDNIQRSKFFSGQFVVNQIVTSNLVIGGYYQGLKTKRTNDNGPLGAGFQSSSTSIFEGTINTGNAHIKWTPGEIVQVTAGYEFESEKYHNDGRTPTGSGNFFARAGQKSHSIFAQSLISLDRNRLQIAGGIRQQMFNLGRPSFSLANAPYGTLTLSDPPSAFTADGAVSYFFTGAGTKLRAHIGNGYRVPSLYERFGTFFSSFGTPSFIAIGDPFLEPEKTIAFDGGIEQNFVKDRLRLSATYFYTRLNETIGYGNVVPNIGLTQRPFGGYQNQKGGISRGGEFSAKLRPSASTDIFSSYTFTNSDQRAPQVSGSRIIRTLGIPDHQFTLVATQRFKRFWVNFDFLATSTYLAPIFSGTTFSTYIYRFDGNRKGDLTAGYTFGFRREKLTLRLFGTIENVFDQDYYENGFRTAGASGRIGLSFGF